MVSLVLGLLITAVLFYLAEIFTSTGLMMLTLAAALIWVSSAVYLLWGKKTIHASVEIPITIAEKGKPFHIQIAMEHGMWWGTRRAKLLLKYGNTMEKKYRKKVLKAEHVASGETVFRFELEINAPGNYEFTLKKIWIYDLFGLFCVSKKADSTANAMVLPEIQAIPLRVGDRVRNFSMDSDVYDELRPGYDPAETFGVREFRDGDKLPNVHWKLSAKNDTLMVRENGLPKAFPVTLFLNFEAKDTEVMTAKAASLAFSLMDQGIGFSAVWPSRENGDLIRTQVFDEEGFFRFLTSMMADKRTEKYEGIKERYYEKYRYEKGLYEICFEEGKVLCNESEILQEEQSEVILN